MVASCSVVWAFCWKELVGWDFDGVRVDEVHVVCCFGSVLFGGLSVFSGLVQMAFVHRE